MKVYELKQILEEALDFLNEHNMEEELNVSCNTYRLPYPFVATYDGFISLNDMFKEDGEDED